MREDISLPRSAKEEIRRFIKTLPSILTGRSTSTPELTSTFQAHFFKNLFTIIREAYLVKSIGGTDSAGIKWKPLQRKTIARRPLRRGEITKLGIGGRGELAFKNRVRGLLTQSQDERWRRIFYFKYAKLRHVMGEEEAKSYAASIAWTILKAEGAQTKLEILGSRQVPILISSSRLLNSLSPGRIQGNQYLPPEEQVATQRGRTVTIGTKVPYAKYQHGTRPLWPSGSRIGPWINEAISQSLNPIASKIAAMIRKEGRR